MERKLVEEDCFFSIKTPFALEALEVQKGNFKKEKSKNLSILQKEKPISLLHSHILEEVFESTYMLFESNQIRIPDEFNPVFVEVIVKYFYFQEIPPVVLKDLFMLFQLSFFMKVEPITMKILDFLMENLTDVKKTSIIFKGALEFTYFFKEDGLKLVIPLIEKCLIFFVKNNHFNEFLLIFDQCFFENMKENLEDCFFFWLNLLKTCKAPNESILKFVQLFKEPVELYMKRKDANFKSESFFRKILQENLTLTDLNLKNIEEFMMKLNINQNDEKKEFMVTVLGQKIAKLEDQNLDLKKELEETRTNEMSLNKKMKEINEKILENDETLKKIIKDSNEKLTNQEAETKKIVKDSEEKLKNEIEKIKKMFTTSREKSNSQKRLKINNESKEKFNKNVNDSKEQINHEKKKIPDKFTTDLEKKLTKFEEIKDDNCSFCPNLDKNYTLSNLNRTLEKITGGHYWQGFRCENPLLNHSGKLVFSMKIEKTIKGYIMMGFCLKNSYVFAGYYESKPSYMIYLKGGTFYNNPNPHSPYSSSNNNIKGKDNEIYTAMFDVKQKSVEFFVNGKSLGTAKRINIKNEEIPFLCPCVDLFHQGDKVTLLNKTCFLKQ